jgi:hypothetical protein
MVCTHIAGAGIFLLAMSCYRAKLSNFAEKAMILCLFTRFCVFQLLMFEKFSMATFMTFGPLHGYFTATNFPRPPIFFYGHISGKWPSPRLSGTSVKQLDPSCDISFGLERVIYLVTRCGIGQQHLLSPATLISWRRQAEASTFGDHKDTVEEESTAAGSAIKPTCVRSGQLQKQSSRGAHFAFHSSGCKQYV